MNELNKLLESINFDMEKFIVAAMFLSVGCIIFGCVGRFVFGKESLLGHSISSAIGILFVYAATVVIYTMFAQYHNLLAPLPFVSIQGETMSIFSFEGTEFTVICEQLLNMIILAFLANLIDTILPTGENIFTWIFFRCLTIVLAMAGQLLITWLLSTYLPQGLMSYAPTVLLIMLVLMLAVGALKIPVGALIATVNPLIGALYTFFFASMVGKAISMAVFTTAILSVLVYGLNYLGITTVAIGAAALIAYIPFVIILVAIWYILNMIL